MGNLNLFYMLFLGLAITFVIYMVIFKPRYNVTQAVDVVSRIAKDKYWSKNVVVRYAGCRDDGHYLVRVFEDRPGSASTLAWYIVDPVSGRTFEERVS